MKRATIYFSALVLGFFTISCEQNDGVKNESSIDDLFVNAVTDDAYNDELVNTVLDDVDYELTLAEASGYSSLKSGVIDDGGNGESGILCRPERIIDRNDSTMFPKVITLVFSGDCESWHGKVRSGKIIITISDHMWVVGSTRVTTFEDFYVDSCKIEGTRTVTNLGINADGLWQQSMTLADGKVTFPDGLEITRDADKIRTWVELPEKRKGYKGTYTVEGAASGVNIDGLAYEMEIITPLFKEMFCPWFVSGIKNIAVEEITQIQIDYGDGECDNVATLTVDGETKEFLIKRKGKMLR